MPKKQKKASAAGVDSSSGVVSVHKKYVSKKSAKFCDEYRQIYHKIKEGNNSLESLCIGSSLHQQMKKIFTAIFFARLYKPYPRQWSGILINLLKGEKKKSKEAILKSVGNAFYFTQKYLSDKKQAENKLDEFYQSHFKKLKISEGKYLFVQNKYLEYVLSSDSEWVDFPAYWLEKKRNQQAMEILVQAQVFANKCAEEPENFAKFLAEEVVKDDKNYWGQLATIEELEKLKQEWDNIIISRLKKQINTRSVKSYLDEIVKVKPQLPQASSAGAGSGSGASRKQESKELPAEQKMQLLGTEMKERSIQKLRAEDIFAGVVVPESSGARSAEASQMLFGSVESKEPAAQQLLKDDDLSALVSQASVSELMSESDLFSSSYDAEMSTIFSKDAADLEDTEMSSAQEKKPSAESHKRKPDTYPDDQPAAKRRRVQEEEQSLSLGVSLTESGQSFFKSDQKSVQDPKAAKYNAEKSNLNNAGDEAKDNDKSSAPELIL